MGDKADQLRARLLRNFNAAESAHELRPPLYDSVCARLATGTEASKLGISIDIVAPGMRACPYTFTMRRKRRSSCWKARAHCVWRTRFCR